MNEVAVFQFPETNQPVRMVLIGGEPWFVARDVCAVLEISNGRDAVSRLPERMKGVGETDTPGGQQRVNVISEAGAYRLAMRSNLAAAERFQDWIAEEVVPSIRRTGRYEATPQHALPQTYADALRELATTVEERDAAREQLAVTGPKAEAWDVLASADGDYAVADAAKILSRDPQIKVGRDRLFTLLRQWGWIYRGGADDRYRVYQTQVETGRLSEKASSHYHPRTGELQLDPPQVRITVKGLEEIRRRLTAATSAPALPAGGTR